MDEYFGRAATFLQPSLSALFRSAKVQLTDTAHYSILGGGFQNWNVLVAEKEEKYVLRFAKTAIGLRKEVSLLRELSNQKSPVPVPKVLWAKSEPTPVAAMSFMEGKMLWDVRARKENNSDSSISKQLGLILARVHAQKFEHFGFLSETLDVLEPVHSFENWTLEFLQDCLRSPEFRSRVSIEDQARLDFCISEHPNFLRPETGPCLCHGDFNEKNILIDRKLDGSSTISAVLDWEYAIISTPYVDIGNLFRFSVFDPWIVEADFEKGYLDAGGTLSPDWRDRSRFLDLICICDFLASTEELPVTQDTMRTLLVASLDHLERYCQVVGGRL